MHQRSAWVTHLVLAAGVRNSYAFLGYRSVAQGYTPDFWVAEAFTDGGGIEVVDLNDDGWLDIVLATHRKGNFVIYSENGDFPADNLRPLPHGQEAMAAGISFGDLDHDGDLDLVFGNWTLGLLRNPHPWSRNWKIRPAWTCCTSGVLLCGWPWKKAKSN